MNFIKKLSLRKKIMDLMLDYNNGIITKKEFDNQIKELDEKLYKKKSR